MEIFIVIAVTVPLAIVVFRHMFTDCRRGRRWTGLSMKQ